MHLQKTVNCIFILLLLIPNSALQICVMYCDICAHFIVNIVKFWVLKKAFKKIGFLGFKSANTDLMEI